MQCNRSQEEKGLHISFIIKELIPSTKSPSSPRATFVISWGFAHTVHWIGANGTLRATAKAIINLYLTRMISGDGDMPSGNREPRSHVWDHCLTHRVLLFSSLQSCLTQCACFVIVILTAWWFSCFPGEGLGLFVRELQLDDSVAQHK